MNYLEAQLLGPALDDEVAALHRRGREKDAVGQVFQMIEIAAHAHFALDLLVVRSEVRIINGPVLARAVDRPALEVPMAQPPGHCVPGHGFAAHAAAALRLEAGNAGPHGGDVAIGKIERHGMRVERGPSVDFRTALDHHDVHAMPRQMRGERATGSSRADNADIVNFLGHEKLSAFSDPLSAEPKWLKAEVDRG